MRATGLTWLPEEEHFGIRLQGRLVAHARTLSPSTPSFLPPTPPALYERLGWQALDAGAHVEKPEDLVVLMPLWPMVTPLTDDAEWPPGSVRVRSLPM
ncbi:hypothetical protein AB0C93_08350 [Streptomyces sp. NPDC048518]|uniref:hypothetical protein n=1 Tax=Streptomyces sp. NPDC048518 TaxID=3155029 RepID=UPI0033C46EA7